MRDMIKIYRRDSDENFVKVRSYSLISKKEKWKATYLEISADTQELGLRSDRLLLANQMTSRFPGTRPTLQRRGRVGFLL